MAASAAAQYWVLLSMEVYQRPVLVGVGFSWLELGRVSKVNVNLPPGIPLWLYPTDFV